MAAFHYKLTQTLQLTCVSIVDDGYHGIWIHVFHPDFFHGCLLYIVHEHRCKVVRGGTEDQPVGGDPLAADDEGDITELPLLHVLFHLPDHPLRVVVGMEEVRGHGLLHPGVGLVL